MQEGSQYLRAMIFDELYLDSVSSVAQAVQSENIQLLQELLQHGHSTCVTDNRGWTPLHVAASRGCVEAVRCLLMADDIRVESLSHSSLSALYLACCGKTEGHRKVVELLLSAEADPNMAYGDKWVVPLHSATENNNLEIVKLLLDAGADLNIEAFKYTTALHAAAEVGALEIARLLLERGANPNIGCIRTKNTALHCLCRNYSRECVATYNTMLDLFLSHGSDINAQMVDGTTALMLAVQAGWELAVDKLLEQGADVYLMKNKEILALHFAIQFIPHSPDKSLSEDEEEEEEDSSVLRKILSVTSHDKIPRNGYSIFHLAIQWKRYRALRMLIEDGLNPDAFLQEMESAIIDCNERDVVPLVVQLHICHDTPLGFLLFQSLTREVVDTAKYMIDKGSSINSLKFGVLPPLVAALKNRHPGAYEEGGLGQEILQYLLERGADIMYKARENDILPAALTVSSLFNVVGFFRLLQHGVPAHRLYTRDTLTALTHHYLAVLCFRAYKRFPWLLVSWLRTANLFVAQLPIDASDILSTSWKVTDEKLTEAWQEVGTLISSPKSLQHLCVLKVRYVLGEGRGWEKLQHSLKQLHRETMLPDPIVDLLHFRWVKTDTLQVNPPPSSQHLYVDTIRDGSSSSDEEPWAGSR